MNKKSIVLFLLMFFSFSLFSQSKVELFIKGNISEKTQAVREATGKDAVFLSKEAINFVLKNKEYLHNDRDLDNLAVAAILSIPSDYIKSCDDTEKQDFVDTFVVLFNDFSYSSNVQTAVISKINSLKQSLNLDSMIVAINDFLLKSNIKKISQDVIKSILSLYQQMETVRVFQSFILSGKQKLFRNSLRILKMS